MTDEKERQMKCRICGSDSRHQFTRTILHRYEVSYFYCAACGFLQTEDPYWLPEAYQSAIAYADTGLVSRNFLLASMSSTLLYFTCPRQGKYLDFGGGYGMFTRLMRDIGFDFYWSDLYCENTLARGFAASTTSPPFDAVTTFEVMEHVPNPVALLRDIQQLSGSRTILFSTELFTGKPPEPDAWWYYAFPTGQHIAFYQKRTLETIGTMLGLRCYSNGTNLHMLTDRPINGSIFRFLMHPRISRILSLVVRRGMSSKMISDHEKMLLRS